MSLWINPKGGSYTGSLFTDKGTRYLYAQSRAYGKKQYEWLVYDLKSRSAVSYPFETSETIFPLKRGLLYGSTAKDLNGNFYVVGTYYGKRIPIMLQVSTKR